MHGSRGCIGCSTIPQANTLMDGALKGQTVKEDKRSDLSSCCSTYEMDQSAAQSQKSISSIGTSSQPSLPQTSSDPHKDDLDFVNHASSSKHQKSLVDAGLVLWNQMREQWRQNKTSKNGTQVKEPRISGDATYESLLGSDKPFLQPIPLGEMVDFLVDVWDEEGLYD